MKVQPTVFALALVGCGAAQVHGEPFLGAMVQPPTLSSGRVQQLVQIEVPDGERGADCRLLWRWRGPSTGGQLGPLAPTEVSGRDVVWRVETEVGAIDVIGASGHVTCGGLARELGERCGGTAAAETRYCGTCTAGTLSSATPARERERPGIAVTARAGLAIEGRDASIVDRCSGRTLLDLSDVRGAITEGGTDRESELALLLAADHGEDVCARDVPGAVHVELPLERVDDVAARLAAIPDVSVVLSLPPMPG